MKDLWTLYCFRMNCWRFVHSPFLHNLLMESTLQSGLCDVLKSLREAGDILVSMQSKFIGKLLSIFTNAFASEQFEDLHDKFSAVQDRMDKTTKLTDFFSPEPSSPTVVQQWEKLAKSSTPSLSHRSISFNLPK